MTIVFGCENCRRGWPHVHGPSVARNSDPETSHAAAASLSAKKIRESQRLIYDALRHYGPMTDEDMYLRHSHWWTMSPSGARTRRSELVKMGKVRDSGRRETLASGRKSIVWEAV